LQPFSKKLTFRAVAVMKIKFASFFITGISSLLFFSCQTAYESQSLTYRNYRITDSVVMDPGMLTVIRPYSDSVNKSMNDVVGIAAVTLEKKSLESTLGNFMVDAFYIMAKQKYNTQVDGAILNYGGIRLNQLPAGNVTRGKVFELMPFDNLLVLQKMSGNVLQQLLDMTAAKGGWPLAGITMQIKEKKAVNIMINGRPIDMTASYTIANSDFVGNGGDDADMLRTVPQIVNGYLMRDAIFDYINRLKLEGKNITATIENRVINVQ
jgi:2',3'-cyclic-nucleotide 2'-phosphodiesterase (5'-nucleotidase family)